MARRIPYLAALLLAVLPLSAQTPAPVGKMAVVGDSSLVVIELKNSAVVATVEPMKVVNDTLEYNPAAYRLSEDAMLEDLLRKIPGLEVTDGAVTLHGKPVSQVLIDGERFFSGNVKTAIQNISADMIAKIRAYERDSDFTRITGIDDGEKEPVLDLKIKKNMMDGWRGNISAGYGMNDRYAGRVSANKIKKNEQNTVLLNFNNLNGKININNASRTQLGGGGSGDVDKREVGANFSRKYKKVKFDANVHYDGNNRDLKSQRNSENIYYDGITSYSGVNTSLNSSNTPTVDGRVEWNPRKDLVFVAKPNLKYVRTDNLGFSQGENFNVKGQHSSMVDNANRLLRDALSGSLYLQFTKRFDKQKKGRNFTLSSNTSGSLTLENTPLTYLTIYTKSVTDRRVDVQNDTRNLATSLQLSYNEPIGKGFHFQAIVYYQINLKGNVRNVYDMLKASENWNVQMPLPPDLAAYRIGNISSQGKFIFHNQKTTLNMRYIRKKVNLTLGLAVNPHFTRLSYVDSLGRDTMVRRSHLYFAPNISLTYNPRKTEKLAFTYRSWSGSPSFYNLLPVNNGTNPLYVHYGNENLITAFTHKLELTYNRSDIRRHSSLVVKGEGRMIQNQVSTLTTYNSKTGGTTAIPLNIDDTWSANASLVYNKAFDHGFSLVQHTVVDYNNMPSYLYDSRAKKSDVNVSRRLMAKASLDATYRNDYLELIANIGGDYTLESASLRPDMNQQPYSLASGLKANVTCPWAMRLTADYSFLAQRGYVFGDLNRNYHVLNATLSQPFAKNRFVLSVEAYDILGQLPNLTRNFGVSTRNVITYNGFNRYVIIKLLYKFKI